MDAISTIPGPSAPVLVRIGGEAYVYVGSSDGRLYQVEADNEAAITSVLLRIQRDHRRPRLRLP